MDGRGRHHSAGEGAGSPTRWSASRSASRRRTRAGGRRGSNGSTGARWPGIDAHGKHLLFDFGDLVLHSHLGMSGGWHVYPRGARWRRPRTSAWAVLSGERSEAVAVRRPDPAPPARRPRRDRPTAGPPRPRHPRPGPRPRRRRRQVPRRRPLAHPRRRPARPAPHRRHRQHLQERGLLRRQGRSLAPPRRRLRRGAPRRPRGRPRPDAPRRRHRRPPPLRRLQTSRPLRPLPRPASSTAAKATPTAPPGGASAARSERRIYPDPMSRADQIDRLTDAASGARAAEARGEDAVAAREWRRYRLIADASRDPEDLLAEGVALSVAALTLVEP